MFDNRVEFDAALIRRYEGRGPRYTSYPTAVEFSPTVDAEVCRRWLVESNLAARPLSLYLHIPFCAHVCYYCGCNKVVTANRTRAVDYLQRLEREIGLRAALLDPARRVEQLHWGGGTPTFLDDAQIRQLMQTLGRHFELADDDSGEFSIEIDPRELRQDTLAVLRECGFNRVSIGVQDFDPRVQQAVHRIQSEAQTLAALEQARRLGFRSVNVDLMYGLPLQTVDSFAVTLEKVIQARPERISVFAYAHLPERFPPQRRIRAEDLPDAATRLELLALSIERLGSAGYQYIGMDHFALADDELARAQREGTLQRNFQGYSTHSGSDLIGMGVSAISATAAGFCQNQVALESYYRELDAGRLPVARGVGLSADDRLRGAVIQQLICHHRLSIERFEAQHRVDFERYFAAELVLLGPLQADGLVEIDADALTVTPRGRLLIRNICALFDLYRRARTPSCAQMI